MAHASVVLVGGVVHRDGKILLLRRLDSKRFFPGHWELPGGKLDAGESPGEAAIRETQEETGIETTITSIYNAWADTTTTGDGIEHIIQIDFILDAENIENITLSEKEHSAFMWASGDGLPKPMTPQMRATIKLAFEHIKTTTPRRQTQDL